MCTASLLRLCAWHCESSSSFACRSGLHPVIHSNSMWAHGCVGIALSSSTDHALLLVSVFAQRHHCRAVGVGHAEAWCGHRHMHGGQPRFSLPTAGSAYHRGSVPAPQAHSLSAAIPSGEPATPVHSCSSRHCMFWKALLATAKPVTQLPKSAVALQTVFSADTHTRSFMQLPKLRGQHFSVNNPSYLSPKIFAIL